MPFRKPILLGFGCWDGLWVGWGVSEVQAAFVTSLATTSGVMMTGHYNSIGAACNLEGGLS
jgi:hypothetical protein